MPSKFSEKNQTSAQPKWVANTFSFGELTPREEKLVFIEALTFLFNQGVLIPDKLQKSNVIAEERVRYLIDKIPDKKIHVNYLFKV